MSDRPPAPRVPAGVYVHIPFCLSRCSYCDFPVVIGGEDRMDAYLDGLEWEIREGQPDAPPDVDTVFFGGGTPSRVPPGRIGRLLAAVRGRFRLLDVVDCYRDAWSRAEDAGLVECSGPRIRLTPRGRLLSNELFADLVAD